MSENYLRGASKALRQMMTAASQTINNSPTVPSDKDVHLRNQLITEEVLEFLTATLGNTPEAQGTLEKMGQALSDLKLMSANNVKVVDIDMLEVVDALVDIEVINIGTALTYGINIDAGFNIVHESNMAKVNPQTGRMDKNEFGKIIKPAGWVAPDLSGLI